MRLRFEIKTIIIGLLLCSQFVTLFVMYKMSRMQSDIKVAQNLKNRTPVKVKVEAATPERNRAQLKEAVLAKSNEVENCYNQYLASRPTKIEGQVTVQWLVQQSGEVSAPEISQSELQNAPLHQCLLAQMESVKLSEMAKLGSSEESDFYFAHKFKFKRRSPASLTFN